MLVDGPGLIPKSTRQFTGLIEAKKSSARTGAPPTMPPITCWRGVSLPLPLGMGCTCGYSR